MIFRILSTVRFKPTFDLQKDFSGICGELESCRYSSLLSVAARIRSIRYLCKKLWQKYWNSAGCFHIRIFPILAWMNFFFFPFPFSHVFDLFNTSKTMLQLILTLKFSWACMISWMILISYKRKLHIMSIFLRIISNSHIYM